MQRRILGLCIALLCGCGCMCAVAGEEGLRFVSLDLWMDSGDSALAAYQVEITYNSGRVKIVGLEGGRSKGFAGPPYYDREGLESGRIVIAAFTTEKGAAPTGRTRVARLHLAIQGAAQPDVSVKVITAAKPGGERFVPKAELNNTQTEE